jgi:NADH dehydrogenase
LFGREDVLINNIAWALRHLPVVGVFGKGDYRLQPIHVDDLAAAAVAQSQVLESGVIEAIGPETFTYLELVHRIREAVGSRARVVRVSPRMGYWSCRVLGWLVGDVILTREEIQGLMENRLCVNAPPLGTTRLTEWMLQHRASLGRRYTSELARRVDRASAYRSN